MKSDNEKAERQHRFKEALTLHEIEGNPLTAEEIAMFEMFEREGWDDDKCRAYILARLNDEQDPALAAE